VFSNKVRKAAIAEIEKYVREIRSRRTETFVSQGEICSVVKPPGVSHRSQPRKIDDHLTFAGRAFVVVIGDNKV
jgi:hypothetical protein